MIERPVQREEPQAVSSFSYDNRLPLCSRVMERRAVVSRMSPISK